MSPRIYTGAEASALLADYTATPRITFGDECLGGVPLCVDGREFFVDGPDDPDGDWIYVDRWEAAMHNAAPGLAATVVHLSADLHRVTMERDGARASFDAAQAARIKQSLELAEARARLDAAHAHIATLERVAFTACGHADDLGEKLSEREEQIAARDEADAKVLRVEVDWYRARRSVADLRGFVATMRAYHGVELIGVDVSAAVALLDAVEDAARVHFAGGAR